MMDNKKEEYTHEINRYTRNIIESLIPKRIVPFDYYEERNIDKEVKNWLERSEGEFAVIIGDAGFGKTSLLCNLANKLLNEDHYAVFFVKSENLRGEDFDKKILDDLEITKMGLNELLKKIIDENKKIIIHLDTLDVIATDDGIARLDDFLIKIKGEKRVVICASRPLEFKRIEPLTTKTFELKPFSDDEIRHLFDRYKAFYKMEGVELRLPVLEVCRNPLHMRMLFEVYQPNEIPEDINTQKLYDKYWDKKVAMIRTGALSHLDEGKKRKAKEVKEDLTKNIASEMLTSKQITLREIDIKKIKDEMQGDYYSKIQSIEVKDSKGPIIATQIIKELILEYNTIIDDAYHDLLDEGVLRAQEDSVEFFHQSFFEYVAARALIEKEDKKQLKYLLNNATLLENRAIIQEVILYAKRKKKDEIAYKLLKRLSETNLYTKIFAIDLLKHIENITEEDIKICQHLTEDEIKIRTYLADSLGLITPIHPDLASMLFKKLSKDKDEYVRKGVTGALPKLYDVNPDLASTLIEKLHSDHPYVRKGVAEALPKLYGVNPGLALALIKKLSKDKNEYVRKSVAEALPKLYGVNPGLALTLIKEFLSQDRSIFAIIGLSEALNKLCDVNPDLASTLIEKLSNDEDPWVQMVIEKTLFKLCDVNPDLASMLIEKLGKDRDEEEEWNEFKARPGIYGRYRLLILFYLDPDLASRLTKKICKYEDPVVRSSAAEALSKLCDVNPDLASTLIEKLSNDEDFIARSGAAKALSKLCDVNPDLASTLIEKLSNDKYLLVRKTVAEALPKFCDVYPDFASTLVEKLSNDKCSLLRSDAANALSKLFEVNPDLTSSLIDKLSNDKDGEVRRYAAKALLKFDELYPNKARALIKKLKDLEDMDIQKAIKEIIEKREKRHLDRYDLIKKGKDRMRRQEIKIEESTEVESTQKIIGGEGEQIAKIKKGEKIRSKQFIGDEKKKTADSQEFLENLHIENLKKSAKNVQMYCQRQLDAFFASDDIYFRFFTNHASLHSQTILKILKELLLDVELKNDYEYYLLYTAAYAHDIGMLPQKTNGEFEDYTKQEVVEKVRKEHSERSAEHIKKNWREMEMLEKTHSVHLADICKAHSSKVDINKVPERAECVIDGEKVEIRWRFLAALIRLADALDADYNRIPPEFILKNAKLSEKTVEEYLKHESVQKVTVSHKDRKIYVDLLLPDDGAMREIKKELKRHLVEEFESVRTIINANGVKIENIEFLETVSSGMFR